MVSCRSLSLRAATMSDADILLAWRNDAETRTNSHSPEPVARDRHVSWLSAALADPGRRIWIADADDVRVGTIRADRRTDDWLLSWTVAPECRGQGYGRAMLVMALALIDGPVSAEIMTANGASRRIAVAAGLKYTATVGVYELWTRGPS